MDTLPELLEHIVGEPGIEADSFHWIEGVDMPHPYQDLLVHSRDMTSTLAHFHKSSIGLEILNVAASENDYAREVILLAESSETPVEYGAIRIHLEHFEPAAREAIVAGKEPLGGLLNRMKCDYSSRPRGFFSIRAPLVCQSRFGCSPDTTLYGRFNRLVNSDEKELASIIEILPEA